LLKNGEAVEIFFSALIVLTPLRCVSKVCRTIEDLPIAGCSKKISGSGHAANPANTTTSTLPASASVDKPMYIHRIECAKPPDLLTSGFLSSFSPCQKQALSGNFKST
jgi:hypothetical protein